MSPRLLALCVPALLASVPAEAAERKFTITGFERIRVDGPFRVKLTTEIAPFAKASGSPTALDRVSVEVQGQTLVVRKNPGAWGGYPGESHGPVEVSVGARTVNQAWLNGAGSLEIDAVKGQTLDLSVQGPGSISVGRIAVDELKVGLTGSGSARLAGSAALGTVIVRGASSLEGSALSVKDATIGAEGTAIVRLTATNTAKVDTLGTALVELSGRPACTVRAVGSAMVSGCR